MVHFVEILTRKLPGHVEVHFLRKFIHSLVETWLILRIYIIRTYVFRVCVCKLTECFKCVSVFEDQTHQLSHLQLPLSSKPWTLDVKVVGVEPALSTTFSWRFGVWSAIYAVWVTFKQNVKHYSKKGSLISHQPLCLIWQQKVIKHTFKSIFLFWVCSFVHTRTSSSAPFCFGACKWQMSLCGQVATMEKCPWLLVRSGLCVQRKAELGLSLRRRPACLRPTDFSCGLDSDTKFPGSWGKLKHF